MNIDGWTEISPELETEPRVRAESPNRKFSRACERKTEIFDFDPEPEPELQLAEAEFAHHWGREEKSIEPERKRFYLVCLAGNLFVFVCGGAGGMMT